MFGRDRERFIKLLQMTASTSDGEVLAAIRKCNDMLAQHKLSWNDVVAERHSRPLRSVSNHPANRAAEAGQDVRWGSSRAFEASIRREKYLEQARRNEQAAAIQVYASKVPFLLRLIFFPLWAAAIMLSRVVIPEVNAFVRAIKLFAAVLLVATCGAAWFRIFEVVVRSL